MQKSEDSPVLARTNKGVSNILGRTLFEHCKPITVAGQLLVYVLLLSFIEVKWEIFLPFCKHFLEFI